MPAAAARRRRLPRWRRGVAGPALLWPSAPACRPLRGDGARARTTAGVVVAAGWAASVLSGVGCSLAAAHSPAPTWAWVSPAHHVGRGPSGGGSGRHLARACASATPGADADIMTISTPHQKPPPCAARADARTQLRLRGAECRAPGSPSSICDRGLPNWHSAPQSVAAPATPASAARAPATFCARSCGCSASIQCTPAAAGRVHRPGPSRPSGAARR